MKNLFLGGLFLTIIGCSHLTPFLENASTPVLDTQFNQQRLQTKSFLLTSYLRITDNTYPLRVYIEGDGRAWISRKQLASNPTPKNPIAFQLAQVDNSPNVVYLARPCQYTPLSKDSCCEEKYWSTARYAPIVIDAMQEAIETLQQRYHIKQIELIGFSGGGNIAALIAARKNKDVISLRTVAGNLNFPLLDSYHQTTPLSESLNAADLGRALRRLPQRHFVGSKDKVVPRFIADSYQQALGPDHCSHIDEQPGFSHHRGWVEHWTDLLKHPTLCPISP